MSDFQIETVHLDLPAVSGAFGRRLHDAGIPVTAERSARFAHALRLVDPRVRRRLYWTARAVFVSDPSQVRAFNAVFAEVFGVGRIRTRRAAPGRGSGPHAGGRASARHASP